MKANFILEIFVKTNTKACTSFFIDISTTQLVLLDLYLDYCSLCVCVRTNKLAVRIILPHSDNFDCLHEDYYYYHRMQRIMNNI
jgi:hypothetical protein